MKESLLKLTKMLAEDEKFLKEFSSKKSVDEQYDFAQKSVSGYTKDEFVSFLDELEKSYELKRDISLEEMEKVSGGAKRNKVAAAAMLALSALSSAATMLTSASDVDGTIPDLEDRPGIILGSEDAQGGSTFDSSLSESQFNELPSEVTRAQIGGIPTVMQSSRIEPNFDQSRFETSEVMRANQQDIGTIAAQLNDTQLGMFDSAKACTDKGPTRIQEIARMQKLAGNIETKSEMLNMIMRTYEKEKAMGINWVHCSGYTSTGYKLEDTPQIRAKLGTKHEGRIINWLLDKFKEGYYLYFEGDKLVLKDGGPKITLLDDVASYVSKVKTDAEYIRTFITELTKRLNRARVFGQSLKAADMGVEGQWVMRDDGQTPQPDAKSKFENLQRYLNKDVRVLDRLNYTNCSNTDTDARLAGRAQLKSYLDMVIQNAETKTDFTKELVDFVNASDVNWTRVTGRRALGMGAWTGWNFKIKDDKKSGFESRAKSGDAYAQVLLWLNARFGQGCYLWPEGDHFVLYNDGNGKFDNIYGSSFTRFVRDTLKVEPVSDRDYSGAITQISKTCNLHRALSGALNANGMKVEANAVMAGTA